MQNAVLHCYPDAIAEYKFTNRAMGMKFSRTSFDWIRERLHGECRGRTVCQLCSALIPEAPALSSVRLQEDERAYLTDKVDFFPPTYVDFLSQLRLNPQDQLRMSFEPVERKTLPGSGRGEEDVGDISIAVVGPWKETILYEVPIMYIMCEGYFKFDDVDWTEDHAEIFGES